MTATDWSPATYLKFEDERTRAAHDLLARVRSEGARKIVDVGCGPGNSTELLALRYREAEILAVDNSPAMLEEARRRLPKVRFELADAAVWVPDAGVDVVFANAIYQWVPGHLEQLVRVLTALPPGATLAVQMPDNLSEPSHRLMGEVTEARGWSDRLAGATRNPPPGCARSSVPFPKRSAPTSSQLIRPGLPLLIVHSPTAACCSRFRACSSSRSEAPHEQADGCLPSAPSVRLGGRGRSPARQASACPECGD